MFEKVFLCILIFWSFCTKTVAPFFDTASPLHRFEYFLSNNGSIPNNVITGFFSYEQSYNNRYINKTLFGNTLSNENVLGISGSQAKTRNQYDLLADYFYLPNNFMSKIVLKPSIQSFYGGIQFQKNLDQENNNFLLKISIPIMYHKTELKMSETIVNQVLNDHDIGYFVSDTSFTHYRCLESARDYFYGTNITNLNETDNFGATIFQPLKYSKIKPSPDAQASIGCKASLEYRILESENYSIIIGAHSNLPFGTKPKGYYLLEGSIGTNPYWTLGGNANLTFSCYKTDSFTLDCDLYFQIEHQFPTRMHRVFDILNKELSRYMLVQKLGEANTTTQLNIGQTTSSYQFQQQFCPLANLTRLPVTTQRSIISDGIFSFLFSIDQFTMRIGSSYTISSTEKIRLAPNNVFTNNTTWALKGDAQMYGFQNSTSPGIALCATESNATIFSGTNYPTLGNPSTDQKISARKNSSVDNKGLANINNTYYLRYDPNALTSFTNTINGSNPPIFLQVQDLDIESAQIQYNEYSLFSSLTYTAHNHIDSWQPFFSIGSSILFGVQGEKKNSYTRSGYRLWNMWLQTGLSY